MRYVHVRYVKRLFTNIQKQQNLLKINLLFRKLTNLNNSKIVRIKNAKFSGHHFYMDINIYGGFQICISVPLIVFISKAWNLISLNVKSSYINSCRSHIFSICLCWIVKLFLIEVASYYLKSSRLVSFRLRWLHFSLIVFYFD